MITSRTTRLLRVPDLQAMHRTIAEIVDATAPDARAAVLVPSAAAAAALALALERLSARFTSAGRRIDLVTRDDFYARLHERLADRPAFLSAFEREVLLIKAADAAAAGGDSPPFRIRPGLVVEILAFYDELRRRDRTVSDFDRLMTDSLQGSIEVDRGAERLYRQTRFLASTFGHFERLVTESGAVDEHALRERLVSSALPVYDRAIVTVADQAAGPRGLWTADFDLLARMPGLQNLDVIATENVLAAGFHQRIHDLLPGIEEERRGAPATPPVLATPAPAGDDVVARRWFLCRDREEELAAVARLAAVSSAPDRVAVVFQRPLPYLYLAGFVFADARQPYRTLDTLPLAAEPFAAALDVVFGFLIAEGNRASTVDLLGSPHWRFAALVMSDDTSDDDDASDASIRERVAALDLLLREIKYLGGWDRLAALAPHAQETGRISAARTQPPRFVRRSPRRRHCGS